MFINNYVQYNRKIVIQKKYVWNKVEYMIVLVSILNGIQIDIDNEKININFITVNVKLNDIIDHK